MDNISVLEVEFDRPFCGIIADRGAGRACCDKQHLATFMRRHGPQ